MMVAAELIQTCAETPFPHVTSSHTLAAAVLHHFAYTHDVVYVLLCYCVFVSFHYSGLTFSLFVTRVMKIPQLIQRVRT